MTPKQGSNVTELIPSHVNEEEEIHGVVEEASKQMSIHPSSGQGVMGSLDRCILGSKCHHFEVTKHTN
jgi:hypothetical protein